MTGPIAPGAPIGWPENQLIWCVVCGIHYAAVHDPKCVVCKDDEKRATS
jgi:hypothetical protein